MKAAILGTGHRRAIDERTLLQQAGVQALQRMAGYIPPTLAANTPLHMPVNEKFALCSDAMLGELRGRDVTYGNPRVPYIALVWMFISADNPFRTSQYVQDINVIIQACHLLLSIAIGYVPDDNEFEVILRAAGSARSKAKNLDGKPAIVAAIATQRVARAVMAAKCAKAGWVSTAAKAASAAVIPATRQRVQEWCYISDDEAGCLIQALMLDWLTLHSM
jgi:hypothetical protein